MATENPKIEETYEIVRMKSDDGKHIIYPATIVDAIVVESGKDITQIVNAANEAANLASNAADKAQQATATIDGKISEKADKSYVDSELAKKQDTLTDGSVAKEKLSMDVRTSLGKADSAVQPAAISDMETKTHASATYQPKGNYLTEHQDISGKVDKVDGKGLSTNDYTTAEKNKLAGIATGANKITKTSELTNDSGFLTAHQDISGKADKTYVDTELGKKQNTISDLSTIRSGASAGATAVQPSAISDMETKTHASATYQPKGNYLTSHQSLANYYTKTEIDSMITATLTANY